MSLNQSTAVKRNFVGYHRGTYYVPAADGKLIRVKFHDVRVRLQRDLGLTRKEAEERVNEIRDYYEQDLDRGFLVKCRCIRDHSPELTDDEVTEVAKRGWNPYHARASRAWRKAAMEAMKMKPAPSEESGLPDT